MLRLKNNIYLSKKEPQSRKASTGVSKLSFLFQAMIHIDFKNELSWTSRLMSSPEKVQVPCLSNQVLFSIFSFWAPKGLFQLEWNGKNNLERFEISWPNSMESLQLKWNCTRRVTYTWLCVYCYIHQSSSPLRVCLIIIWRLKRKGLRYKKFNEAYFCGRQRRLEKLIWHSAVWIIFTIHLWTKTIKDFKQQLKCKNFVDLLYSAIFLNFLFVIERRHDANDQHGL